MALSKAVSRIQPGKSTFFLCDIQERFRPLIHRFPTVVSKSNVLVRAMALLEVPVVVTEQNPRALGSTVAEIDVSSSRVLEKQLFSMLTPEVEAAITPQRTQVGVALLPMTCLQHIQDNFCR
jgi:hypothetical protein